MNQRRGVKSTHVVFDIQSLVILRTSLSFFNFKGLLFLMLVLSVKNIQRKYHKLHIFCPYKRNISIDKYGLKFMLSIL